MYSMRPGLQLRVILDHPTPAYRQVCDQLRALCVQGALEPGDKLPSVRELAGQLGVHHNTVAEAYRTLADEGFLAVEQGRGVRVLDRRSPKPPTIKRSAEHSSRLHHLVAELRGLGLDPQWIRQQVDAALKSIPEKP
jgi:GntR family transcriptional regulator